jgi:hypothetical protein
MIHQHRLQSPERDATVILPRVLLGQSTQAQRTAHRPGNELGLMIETLGDGDENLAPKNEVATVEQEDIASEETAEARVWIRIEWKNHVLRLRMFPRTDHTVIEQAHHASLNMDGLGLIP